MQKYYCKNTNLNQYPTQQQSEKKKKKNRPKDVQQYSIGQKNNSAVSHVGAIL